MGEGFVMQYVNHLPDLISWEDYNGMGERKVVRFQLIVTEEGLAIVGDSPYAALVEKLLAELGAETIEMMLCG